ncbi:MAG TPA: hypothetical protein VGS08_01545 [Candidatus Saccharimonadales bacterium]|nr:hypothetical protein [Candidatus Saccharimonadales bacterium]
MQQGLADIRSAIANGTFDQSGYDSNTIGDMISDMIDKAIEAGDQSQAEADLDFLLRLPGVDGYIIAGVCYNVAIMGNQRAFNILRGRLEAEKIQVTADLAYLRESRPDILRLFMSSIALDQIIIGCEDNGIPPDRWIDDYAIDPEHQWRLYTAHYRRMAESDRPDAEAAQIELERRVSEFATDKSFAAAFVCSETEYLLQVVKNPEVQAQLLSRYMEAIFEIPFLTPFTFRQHLAVGDVVLADPALATQENIKFFEDSVAACAEALHDAGMDASELKMDQLSWRLSLKQHYGATPQELIGYLDLQISQILAADTPELPKDIELHVV